MRKTFWLFLLWQFSVRCLAQNEANIWYFGVNAGLNFNVTPPTALTNGSLSTSEGCATLCDKNGNLLFYSDGIRVWDRTHAQMPNGFGLMGDPSAAQSAIIVPRPGNPKSFYIFTVDNEGQANGVRYSEVDMTLNGGLGDVTVKNTLLHAPSTEKITAVRHANGVYYWVISHGLSNNRYYAHLVDCNGVQFPVITNVGSIEGPPGWGYHVASPDGRRLATAMRGVGFELLDFDNATGVLSNPVQLGFGGECYGVSFSPNNNVLYGLKIGNGQLIQWNLQAGSAAAIIASATTLGNVPGSGSYDGGALQLGPDGKLYIIQCNDPFLTVVHQPDVLGAGSNLQFNAVDLAGRRGILGLPPFIQSFFDTTTVIQVNGNCERQAVSFSMSNVSSFLDSVLWTFGDPSSGTQDTSTVFSQTHTYASAGTYTVRLIRYLNCISDTVEMDVVIDTSPTYTQDVTICTSVSFTRPGGSVVSAPGVYRDTLAAMNGCDSVVVTNLSVLGGTITASNDTAICLGSSVQLNVQGGVFGQTWSPALGLSDSTLANPVATPQQTTTYIVTSQVPSDELIANGDFSGGAGSFSSAYSYTANLNPEGTYYVGANPNNYHSGFNACPDHTSGSGNMMVINGSGNPGTQVWCQSVNVLPNTNYAFSCWVQSVVANSPALLQFSINSGLLGSLFSAPSSACTWQQFYVIWNSGSNTVANICIVNQNTALGGNDFAIDDISFIGLCNAADTVTVTVHQPTTTTIDTTICEGLVYLFPDGTSATASASNTSLLTSRFGCNDSTVITNLTVNPAPVVNVDDSICPGSSFTRPSGIVVTDAGDYTDTISNNAGCDSVVITHLTLRALKFSAFADTVCIGYPYTLPDGSIAYTEGVHSVVLQAANGCDSTVTVTLDHFDIGMQVTPPVTIDIGETVDLHATSVYDPAVAYSWTPSTALTCDNCTTVSANPQEDIVYTLRATMAVAGNVCYDTNAIPVTVIPDHSVFVPNAFTPNGDGSNDFFEIFGNLHAIQSIEAKIFDRTGEKVFESNDIHFKWDGTYNNKKLNPAVFVYAIKVSYVDYFPDKLFKGSVTLMR